jgi:hypothetical protein
MLYLRATSQGCYLARDSLSLREMKSPDPLLAGRESTGIINYYVCLLERFQNDNVGIEAFAASWTWLPCDPGKWEL